MPKTSPEIHSKQEFYSTSDQQPSPGLPGPTINQAESSQPSPSLLGPSPSPLGPITINQSTTLSSISPPTEAQAGAQAHSEVLSRRREFRARLVSSGRIKRADGAPGPFVIPESALQQAYWEGMFDSLAVFVDHPGWFENASMKSLVGITRDSSFSSDAIYSTLRFYNSDDNDLANSIGQLFELMLADNKDGIPPPDIGMSLVFWPEWEAEREPGAPRVLKSFRKIDSCDIVFGPAADGRILEALSSFNKREVNLMSEQKVKYETAVDKALEPDETTAPAAAGDPVTPAIPAAGSPDQPALETLVAIWTDAAGREAARSIIANSQLPQISKEKLTKQDWSDPDALYAAIEEERAYLAELTQSNVITLRGGPPRGDQIQAKSNLGIFQNAIDWIFGVDGAKTPEPSLRRMDMIYHMMTGDHEFQGVFRPERVFLASADTGTLANMAANAMNKVVIAQLALLTHYRWYEWIVKPTPNDGSLHDMAWTSLGGIATLPVVTEGGAYDELDVDDVKEADSWYTYGGYVGITRKMIKNSDIQRIQAIPRALAAASVKTRSAKIAAIFTTGSGQGPVLDQDSNELFKSGNEHGNYATTALGTDMTAWRAAAAAMFKQTEVNSGDRIGIFPKYCLVPADLYHVALSNFGYGEGLPTTYLPEAQDRGVGDPRPVVLAVPNWTDATDWAYIADPNVWPVIHMSFSQDPSGRGFPAPELFAATSETGGLLFAADVLPIKVRDEFAYGVNGYRGIGKRIVAG